MTKYTFDELPDWARNALHISREHRSKHTLLRNKYDVPDNDIVYLDVIGTWFNTFDLDLIDRSNHACLLRDYPNDFVEYISPYSRQLMLIIPTTKRGKLRISDEIYAAIDAIAEYAIYDSDDYNTRENEEIERQFIEYVQTIAPNTDDDAALDILTEYGEHFNEHVYLDGDYIVLDDRADEFIKMHTEETK